jgi:hypothetical protein
MDPKVEKFGPLGVVLCFLVYCAWGHVWGAAPAGRPAGADALEIKPEQLMPKVQLQVARDPFGRARYKELQAQVRNKAAGQRARAAAEPQEDVAAQANSLEAILALAARLEAQVEAAKQARLLAEQRDTEQLAKLTLQATFVQGADSYAMINSKRYRPGDRVSADKVEVPLVVQRIEVDKVVLKGQYLSMELGYEPRESGRTPTSGNAQLRHEGAVPRG